MGDQGAGFLSGEASAVPKGASFTPAVSSSVAPPPPLPPPSPPPAQGQHVCVHGLAPSVTAKDLAGFFSQHGRLLGVTVKRPRSSDPAAPVGMGVGFVNFAQAADAERACRAADGVMFAGSS